MGWTNTSASAIINCLYPVGHILITENPNNPATYLGVGTWVAYGTGMVPVGIDTNQTEFNSVGKTGGAKTHKLLATEMPAHNHSANLAGRTTGGNPGSATTAVDPGTVGSWTNNSNSISINNSGGDGYHNNLQPYIVTYMFKRTA